MSSITSLAASLASAIEKEAKDLEERKGQLDAEKERLEEEKSRMSRFAAMGSDLVKINVGGKVFQTQRSTLLSAEGTLLEAIFSGRWEESLVRDESGNVFFDFDPAPFRALLNYLRTRSLAVPGQAVPLPHVPPEHKEQFEAMASFMGVKEIFRDRMQAQAVLEEAMLLSQEGSRDGSVTIAGGLIQHRTGGGHHCITGGAPLLSGMQMKVAWKVSILNLHPSNPWAYLGLCASPTPADNSYSDVGSYGWAGSSQVYMGGRNQSAAGGWQGWQTGDVAIFQLDATQNLLRMHLTRTGSVYSLPLPDDVVRSAHLHFNFCDRGDSMEVLQATESELIEAGF